MLVEMARCEQFDAFRPGEGVAVPVQHRHVDKMRERAVGPAVLKRDRMKADFLDRAGKDLCAERRCDHLRAEAHAQGRPVRLQPQAEPAELAGDPGMAILLIDAHRAAHHDEQVRLAQVQRLEGGIGHVDPVDRIAGLFDRLAIASDAFIGDMADDERAFHVSRANDRSEAEPIPEIRGGGNAGHCRAIAAIRGGDHAPGWVRQGRHIAAPDQGIAG